MCVCGGLKSFQVLHNYIDVTHIQDVATIQYMNKVAYIHIYDMQLQRYHFTLV